MKMNIIAILTLLISCSFIGIKDQLPSVELIDLKGDKINIQEHTSQGKLSIVSLWATWCGPCRKELNAYKSVHEEWTKKYNVEFIAISTDRPKARNKMKSMISSQGWNYTMLQDHTGAMATELNVRSIPMSYLVNGKGEIIDEHLGYYEGYLDELEKKIKKHIK